MSIKLPGDETTPNQLRQWLADNGLSIHSQRPHGMGLTDVVEVISSSPEPIEKAIRDLREMGVTCRYEWSDCKWRLYITLYLF